MAGATATLAWPAGIATPWSMARLVAPWTLHDKATGVPRKVASLLAAKDSMEGTTATAANPKAAASALNAAATSAAVSARSWISSLAIVSEAGMEPREPSALFWAPTTIGNGVPPVEVAQVLSGPFNSAAESLPSV